MAAGTEIEVQTFMMPQRTSIPEYLAVEIDFLRPDATKPFQVYIVLGRRHIPYLAPGTPFSREIRDKLQREGIRTLYIHEQDKAALRSYLNQNLAVILHDPSLTHEKKSKILRETCLYEIEKLWEAPTAESIQESKQVFQKTIDYILAASHQVMQHMIPALAHDPSIYSHSVNVGLLGTVLAKTLSLRSIQDLHEAGYALFLHDIGKTQIDHRILSKPAQLSDAEWENMKRHPEIGYRLLLKEGHLTPGASITTLQHHERCDGTGYPYGLKAHQIEPLGRICNLVDSYDALLTHRPYKPALSVFQALKIMKEEMESHFDRKMFEKFVCLLS